MNNNNDTSKQSFAGYRHMNHCLQDQSTNHGLDHNSAINACSKLLQDHLKQKKELQQQPAQQEQPKTAKSWSELRSIILRRS